jgi:hypothetical protein
MLAPIVVGFAGKRELQNPVAVRGALCRTMDLLDDDFPHSRKIMLNMLASGADTIAAEEALKRPNWRIVAPLPLPIELYGQDFDASGAARMRELAAHQMVRVKELEQLIDRRTSAPFATEALSRRPDEPNPDRTDHYEQSGLFIAQSCALLIAVLPSNEMPGRVGGTARTVQSKLSGQGDAKAQDVIQQSRILHSPGLLEAPDAGPVWRIDPSDAKALEAQTRPFEVLLPPAWRGEKLSPAGKLKLSMQIPERLEDFNRRCVRMPDAVWQEEVIQRADGRTGDAAALLLHQRYALSAIQQRMKMCASSSVIALAVLFVLGVAALEIYAAWPGLAGMIALICNIFIIAIALGLHFVARYCRWATYAEDYRAASEALRVQIAWWSADCKDRVDRVFLRDAIGSLSLVRAGLTNLINAAVLTNDVLAGQLKNTWVEDQVKYFKKRARERRRAVKFVDIVSWAAFFCAVGLALYLGRHEMAYLFGFLSATVVVLLGLVAAGIVPLFRSQRVGIAPTHARRTGSIAGMGGLAVGLGGCLVGGWLLGAPIGETAHHVLIVLSVALAALAGAVRFVSEKLSWEAEARSYLEVRELFRRAKARLQGLRDDEMTERRAIIRELGEEALAENEAWVRAHRERPVEPLLGG